MAQINNVNTDALQTMAAKIDNDLTAARRMQVIEGEWLLDGPAQFRSTITYEGGKVDFEMSAPTFLGGNGQRPSPLHYCYYGLAACYTGTFANIAAMMGVQLQKLTCRVEADVNFSRVFGQGDDPVVSEVRIILQVVSDAPEVAILEAEKLAAQRCPAVYSLVNPVKLVQKVEIAR